MDMKNKIKWLFIAHVSLFVIKLFYNYFLVDQALLNFGLTEHDVTYFFTIAIVLIILLFVDFIYDKMSNS